MTTTDRTANIPAPRAEVRTEFAHTLLTGIKNGDIPYASQPPMRPGRNHHGESLQGVFSVPNPQLLSITANYTRMFPELDHFVPDAKPLMRIGNASGPMKAVEDPQKLDTVPAGYTYFGQFLDHNITFIQSRTFDTGQTPESTQNARSGRIDLAQLYGAGPDTADALFYDRKQLGKFWLDSDHPHDVPRNKQGTALIADPRNDTNVIVLQLHLLFMKFHNAIVDSLTAGEQPAVPQDRVFSTAKQLVTWHFQWLVLNDYLPRIVCEDVYNRVVRQGKPKFWCPETGKAQVPDEFATAAYRLHSLPTAEYQVNGGENIELFYTRTPFEPIPEKLAIDWSYFFDLGGKNNVQYAKAFDGTIVEPFLNIPGPTIDNPLEWPPNVPPENRQDLRSIAVRNMLRGRAFGLPSGQDVARRIGATVYPHKDFGPEFAGLNATPLWLYVMKEAQLETDAHTLGSVGSTIVTEVIYGLIKADNNSYLNQAPDWQPKPMGGRKSFSMADVVDIAASMAAPGPAASE